MYTVKFRKMKELEMKQTSDKREMEGTLKVIENYK